MGTRHDRPSPAAVLDILQDVWTILQDHDDVWEMAIQSLDGTRIHVCRLLLASRSPVCENMLYDDLARHLKVLAVRFDRLTAEALVECCRSNELHRFRQRMSDGLNGTLELLRLYQAAEELHMSGLQCLVRQLVRSLVASMPSLACVVLEETPTSSRLHKYALHIIQGRPYSALDVGTLNAREGGVTVLSKQRLAELLQSPKVEAVEAFLLAMLNRWYKQQCQIRSHPIAQSEAKQLAKFLDYENIDPSILLERVQEVCPFVARSYYSEAFARWAFPEPRWSLRCRGCSDEKRILVEGAGLTETNGIYYRLQGLANGHLCTKREITCGQEYIYSLSIMHRKNSVV